MSSTHMPVLVWKAGAIRMRRTQGPRLAVDRVVVCDAEMRDHRTRSRTRTIWQLDDSDFGQASGKPSQPRQRERGPAGSSPATARPAGEGIRASDLAQPRARCKHGITREPHAGDRKQLPSFRRIHVIPIAVVDQSTRQPTNDASGAVCDWRHTNHDREYPSSSLAGSIVRTNVPAGYGLFATALWRSPPHL